MKKIITSIMATIIAMSVSVSAFAYSNGTYNTNYDWMNTRSGPGLGYSLTGQLPRNSCSVKIDMLH